MDAQGVLGTVTPVERHLVHALEGIREMPLDRRLQAARDFIVRACDLIADFDQEWRGTAREMPTEPAPPPSFREPIETMPEGAR